jgi:hypothetical protein
MRLPKGTSRLLSISATWHIPPPPSKQIDQIYRDEEDTTILIMACYGSTGDLLSSLLNARAIPVGSFFVLH